jgi:hypothetical protein
MAVKIPSSGPALEVQLEALIDKLDPPTRKLLRAVRKALRQRFPSAHELAYEYSFALVLGYSPTDRGIDAILALRASTTGLALYFSQGPVLPDPKRMLRGTGKQVRFLQLESIDQLGDPDVEALIAATLAQAKIPFPAEGKGTLVLKSEEKKAKTSRKKPAK